MSKPKHNKHDIILKMIDCTKHKFLEKIVSASTLLRVVIPFGVFKFPILTTISVFLLDLVDGQLYRLKGVERKKYNAIDKGLDLYWYAISLVYVIAYLPHKTLMSALFAMRLAAYIAYCLTKQEKYFLYLPNFYENLLFYLIATTQVSSLEKYSTGPVFIASALFLSFIKVFQEYFLHTELASKTLPQWMQGPTNS